MNTHPFWLLLLFCLISTIAPAQTKKTAAQAPKLVVAIVIDQFRYDYLERFRAYYLPASKSSGGFNRLLASGALFTNAHYPYINTYTAPGHATLFTGVMPARSGIVGNEWIDRSTNRMVYCVEDTSVSTVGINASANSGKMSPRNALVSMVTDHLKTISPKSKVIGIALKDRGAILPAGKKADAAFWFDAASGKWISSSYYFPNGNLPKWLENFNERKLPESYLGKEWVRLLPDSAYTMPDDAVGESNLLGEERPVFPHKVIDATKLSDPRLRNVRRFEAIAPTPFGNELTIEIAKAAIEGEALGQRGVTDVLTISFSSVDYCGHAFGPDSQEQMDIVVRLDRQLSDFFQYLDKKIGFENCWFALSADHGVSPLPEQLQPDGKRGERLFKANTLDSLRRLVSAKYPNVVGTIENDEVVLNRDAVAKLGYSPSEVERFVGECALQLRGVIGFVTRTDLEQGSLDATGKMVKHSFFASRSGDVKLLLRPYSFFAFAQTGTTHGTAYDYDTHVPMLFCGKGIRPGKYHAAVWTTDFAPTLHYWLGLPPELADYDGRPLYEIFEQKDAQSARRFRR
ncbi:MAG: alkaline phosphatase family protein [Chloroherpetonaceae bacterium]|nr:alkaline phosphatase family protein [Chloroherpetonaceae bacterium]MCS7210656.1 alkaline phosphatase family protein [Chloroherpetonaceae bacterium]MDW8020921.1 alkaline phosphatase family protein [Chloroherpetonaceae bacterium]